MPVLVVVLKPGTVSWFASKNIDEKTQIPIIHLARLRNVLASVGETVDSRQEQAGVGKQNKHIKKELKQPISLIYFISVGCVTFF